jgi:hypothetical protein
VREKTFLMNKTNYFPFISALDENNPTKPIQVVILLIDSGKIKKARAIDLMKLPDQFAALPPLVYTLHIFNFVPHDHDHQFDTQTTSKVESILLKEITKSAINLAEIDFSVGDTVYSSNFRTFKYLTKSNAWSIKFNLKKCLLRNEYAVYDEEVRNRLHKLVKNANFVCDNSIKEAAKVRDEKIM